MAAPMDIDAGIGQPSPLMQGPAPVNPRKRAAGHNPETIIDQRLRNIQTLFTDFLANFKVENEYMESTDAGSTNTDEVPFYLAKLTETIIGSDVDKYITLYIDFTHLRGFDIADLIMADFVSMHPYLNQGLADFARSQEDYLRQHKESFTSQHIKFSVGFYNLSEEKKIRELKCEKIGHLTSVTGTITRTSEVRPELIVGNFICDECGHLIKNVEQQFKYTLPTKCTNTSRNCKNTVHFSLDIKGSRFADWQRIRLQEASEDIPQGSMPRSIDVILRDDVVEKAKPGDKVVFTGSLIPVPDVGALTSRGGGKQDNNNDSTFGVTGLKSLGVRSLQCKLIFLACSVVSLHNGLGTSNDDDENVMTIFSQEEKQEILNMKNDKGVYGKLAKSIAPNIFGHDDIKRGILLMLFGGLSKRAEDYTKLRGDINICIVGDPSTAKSQFLKFVTKILPRTVYTSGKASSAAGLTAAVTRDPDTGDFGIEAGALMLADNGVCCIDEFDKMDPTDQAAIHEAMEQQTITITKAGIQATLNARASILAAANPRMGRYDVTRSLRANVDISPPIMSRFDLFFIVVDECDEALDTYIAQHIVDIHKNVTNENESIRTESLSGPYSVRQMQNYIRFARFLSPKITPEAKECIINYYKQFRLADDNERKAYKFTVRQLESLIRLSEALARVHLNSKVTKNYVQEAARLLKQTIRSVDQGEVELNIEDEVQQEEEPEQMVDDREERFSISYQEYLKIAKAAVFRVRTQDEGQGVKQATLENLLVPDILNEFMDDEQALVKGQEKISFTINRLINTDNILLICKDSENEKERMLQVHPNYDPSSRYEIQDRKRKEQQIQAAKKKPAITQDEDAEMAEEPETTENNNNNNNENVDEDDEKEAEDEPVASGIAAEIAAVAETGDVEMAEEETEI